MGWSDKLRNMLHKRSESHLTVTSNSNSMTPPLPLNKKPIRGDKPAVISRKDDPEEVALQIRDLNELILKRYALDIEIYTLRDCSSRDRWIVEDKMRRSDATLVKIRATVQAWDSRKKWKSPADYEKITAIREMLNEGGKRIWADNPPWED